ncbi:RHS repeat-associated core domain-containing protein [Flavobacterium sp. FlaQc-48]|uniref:RHS repeat-associated core domain-containing protein n=1 Tax=Flavobacterium sp. FlaQc-48 TaxID=3374181 RepID=UPI0037581B2D
MVELFYCPDVLSYSDYYPFGMQVPTRHGQSDSYRYGFQGQEKDDELKGEGNSLNYTFRIHDPRIGRFFAIDPLTKKYPWYTPYSFSGNKVIQFVELEGLEESGTNAGSVIMSILFPLPSKIKNNPQRYPGAHGLSFAGKSAALAVSAPPLLAGAAYGIPQVGVAYEAYSTWYGTTATAGYFAGGVGGTASAAMLDAGGYFGAPLLHATGTKAVISGLADATGQIAYNGGFSKFNIAQTGFATILGNPLLSNLGQSNISFTMENGWDTNNFDSTFFSTFVANFVGAQIGAKFETSSQMYKPAKNVLDYTAGSIISTSTMKLGTDLKNSTDSVLDFKIDKSFDRKKTNSKF